MLICPKCSKPMEHNIAMRGDVCPQCKFFRPDKDKVELLAKILYNMLKKMDKVIFKEEIEEINHIWEEIKVEEVIVESKKKSRRMK